MRLAKPVAVKDNSDPDARVAAIYAAHYQQLAGFPYHFYVLTLALVLGASIVLLLGAMTVFGRIEGNFAEEL